MSSLITCIIPAYNAAQYLAAAVESARAQDYAPVEIVLVDDGSSDATPAIAKRFGDALVYLRQDNQGPVVARNRGLDAAKGAYVAFLDADDLWRSDKLTRQMDCFQARPDLDLCLSSMQNFSGPAPDMPVDRSANDTLSEPLPAGLQGAFIRRALFERIGRFDTGLAHKDGVDWLVRATESGALVETIPTVTLYRRVHDTNRSRDRDRADHDELLKIAKASLERQRKAGA